MDSRRLPAVAEIRAVITEEVTAGGGNVLDCFIDEDRLFLRSVLPGLEEVLPGDAVQGGVAAMVTDAEILVHPYTFRLVCRNGAIWAQAIQTRRVQRVESGALDSEIAEVVSNLRGAVRACSEPAAFSRTAGQMRSATERNADMMLQFLPFLSGGPRSFLAPFLPRIIRRFAEGRDRSTFGLMNVVTSVARDESNAESRWRLEELGGALVQNVPAPLKPRFTAAAIANRSLVGASASG